MPSLAEDTDECAINNGGCDHLCTNTPNSFYCSCRQGYVLQPDRKTCRQEDTGRPNRPTAVCRPPPPPAAVVYLSLTLLCIVCLIRGPASSSSRLVGAALSSSSYIPKYLFHGQITLPFCIPETCVHSIRMGHIGLALLLPCTVCLIMRGPDSSRSLHIVGASLSSSSHSITKTLLQVSRSSSLPVYLSPLYIHIGHVDIASLLPPFPLPCPRVVLHPHHFVLLALCVYS